MYRHPKSEDHCHNRELPRFSHLLQTPLRECDSVAAAALEHIGKSYRIARELNPTSIDCSTIVSQSHWVGAAIQTPFIAETQRHASNGIDVSLETLLPGDAIFAYPSLREAPDRAHNHVALYLGIAVDGEAWVIESVGGKGVVFTQLAKTMMAGGIRRFCPNPIDQFSPGPWVTLARRVPKLGRLGARLTARYGPTDRHTGIDVYVGGGTKAVAPFAGDVVAVERTAIIGSTAFLWSRELHCLASLGPLRLSDQIRSGASVRRGQVIGLVDEQSPRVMCNIIPGYSINGLLHWELWASEELGSRSSAPTLDPPQLLRRLAPKEEFKAYNPLYAVKLNIVGSCISNDYYSQ